MLGPKPDDLYAPTRRAVEDALWHVIGTVAYGLFLGLLGVAGLLTVVLALSFGDGSPVSFGAVGVGALVTLGSVRELHVTFDLGSVRRRRRPGR